MARMWSFHSTSNPASGSFTPRETSGSRKTRTPAEARSRVCCRIAQRTGSHHGATGRTDRDADRGDSRAAPQGRGFLFRADPNRTSELSRLTSDRPRPKAASVTSHSQSARRTARARLWTPRPDRDERLVFQSRHGNPLSDSNLLHRHLKPTGLKIGAPWLNWHTLRRTHATLLQAAGASLRDAQVQLGHSKMSTTLELYTVPIPAHLREAVENLSQLVTNGDEFGQTAEGVPTTIQ